MSEKNIHHQPTLHGVSSFVPWCKTCRKIVKEGTIQVLLDSLNDCTLLQQPFKMINVAYLNLTLETLSDIIESGFLDKRERNCYIEYLKETDIEILESVMNLLIGKDHEKMIFFFERNINSKFSGFLCQKNVSNSLLQY